jgi:aspartate/methionine/tyrosine aminotransferase
LEAIADILRKHPQVWVFADEIYGQLVYDGEFNSIASLPGMQERTILSDGCSKTWATIDRLAIGLYRQQKVGTLPAANLDHQHRSRVPFTPAVPVGRCSGLESPTRRRTPHARVCLKRRNLIVSLLNQLPGVKCQSPGGAFCAWPNVTEACRLTRCVDSEEFRKRLLLEAGVAVLADIHFGPRVTG